MYKILIVDDELIFRHGLHVMLKKSELELSGIREAADGEEALRLLEKEEFDIIITDIRMPGMDGLMLCRRLQERHSGVAVVILSGYDEFKYAQQAIRYGVSNYLLKPLSQSDLIKTVTQIIRDRETGGGDFPFAVMDYYVSRLSEQIWEKRTEDQNNCTEQLFQELSRFPIPRQEKILVEILGNVARKLSEKLGITIQKEIYQSLENGTENRMGRFKKGLAHLSGIIFSNGLFDFEAKVRQYLLKNPDLTQEEISGFFGMSPTYFSLVFKERTGKKFVDYRTGIRMENAKRLLCIPAKSVAEVAYESGYGDYSHFVKAFKKYFGITPAQFRADRGLR